MDPRETEWPIFSLEPYDTASKGIIAKEREKGSVPGRSSSPNGGFIFSTTFRSAQRDWDGYFLTIGRESSNDIQSNLVGKDAAKISRCHCAFFFTKSGELMLDDLSSSQSVQIYWAGRDGQTHADYHSKYNMVGEELRRRVIPMTAPSAPGKIVIKLMDSVKFEFAWKIATGDPKTVTSARTWFVDMARGLPAPTQRSGHVPRTQYEPTTVYTPVVQNKHDIRALRETHAYRKLGAGSFGTVSQAVDLATGKLWAVKRCIDPGTGESWKADFQREVEALGRLDHHENIIRLEHHQGWSTGLPIEIFMPLCEGNVDHLFEPFAKAHKCHSRPTVKDPRWLPDFIDQVLSGLSFLQQKKMLHQDLKPDNVLYTLSSNANVSYKFMLSDFGLAVCKREGGWGGGTPGALGYRAPEITQKGTIHANSDLYSFGLMLLELLGVYCLRECSAGFDWRNKLKEFGIKDYQNYRDETPKQGAPPYAAILLAGHSRAESLVAYEIVPKTLWHVLARNPSDRLSAAEARARLLLRYPKAAPAGGQAAAAPRAPDRHQAPAAPRAADRLQVPMRQATPPWARGPPRGATPPKPRAADDKAAGPPRIVVPPGAPSPPPPRPARERAADPPRPRERAADPSRPRERAADPPRQDRGPGPHLTIRPKREE